MVLSIRRIHTQTIETITVVKTAAPTQKLKGKAKAMVQSEMTEAKIMASALEHARVLLNIVEGKINSMGAYIEGYDG